MGYAVFYVYIIENASGRFHVGHTDDLERRVAEHNDPERARSTYAAKHGS